MAAHSGGYADSMTTSSSLVPTDTMYKLALRGGQYTPGKEGREAPAIAPSPVGKAWSGGGGGGGGRGVPAGIDTNDELAGRSSGGVFGSGVVSGSGGAAMDLAGIWLSVFYSEERQWRKISFPPGVTVGQARDICMLRFNVWHRVMERDIMRGAKAQQDSSARDMPGAKAQQDSSARDLYGLYWPAGGQWLEPLRLVGKYGLAPGDILELQDVGAFIPTPAEVTKNILVVEHSRQQQAQQQARLAVADTLSSAGMAEGAVHYLHAKNLSASWRLCWLELADHQLVCHRKQGAKPAQALARINLARGFRLVDQHGNAAGAGGGAPLGSDPLGRFSSDSGSVHSAGGASSMASILGLAAHGRAQLGGDGAALIIKCEGQVHVFCTLSAVDYDSWRRALHAEKGHHHACDASTAASSFDQPQPLWATPSSIAASSLADCSAPCDPPTAPPPMKLAPVASCDPPTAPPPMHLAPSAPSAPSAPAELSVRRSRSFVSSISRIDWPVPPTTLPSAAGDWHHHARHQQQRAEMPSISRAASRTATDGPPSPGSPAPPMPSSQQRDHLHRSLMLLPARFPWFRRSTPAASASATPSPAMPPKRRL